eukprot:14463100-Alexandrium_andersonii.AAC.1
MLRPSVPPTSSSPPSPRRGRWRRNRTPIRTRASPGSAPGSRGASSRSSTRAVTGASIPLKPLPWRISV